MPDPARRRFPRRAPLWRQLLLSAALHLAVLGAALWLIAPPSLPVTAPDRGIPVAIVTLPPPTPDATAVPPAPPGTGAPLAGDPARDTTTAPAAGDEAHAPAPLPVPAETGEDSQDSAAKAPAVPQPPEPAPRIKADKLYSAGILADPRSREALKELSRLVPEDRIIQLCNVEAMEQVHVHRPELHPDLLIAYAMGDADLEGLTLRAEGGAIRSDRHWFRIGFSCEVSPDLTAVRAFDFALGDPIPESEWEAHFLTADDPVD
ncbi:hypothetical protein AWJ14_13050 [Hoeflea olei]|uniref:DUF930 domain-containing protein n=2 Tax=Hoeflea olei TaxID=1480615 RepID=A0A1C1YV16_9HYPH|nr:hypothetical protein AWJ14_13050 [Hoeflea olei]